MSAVHQKNNNTTSTSNQPGDYDSPDDLYQDPEDIDFHKPSSSAVTGNSPMNNHRNIFNRNDTTDDDDDIYDDPEVANQLYQDPENVNFHSKPTTSLVGGGGDQGRFRDDDDDIDEGAYHDPDTEGAFHVIPPMATKPDDGNDDADDLYQDPEEIDFRHPPIVASHRNDNRRADYESPDDDDGDDYSEPPPDARVPVVPAHQRPMDKGV